MLVTDFKIEQERITVPCEVEFMTLTGDTIGVVTLEAGNVRPITEREIAHARQVA